MFWETIYELNNVTTVLKTESGDFLSMFIDIESQFLKNTAVLLIETIILCFIHSFSLFLYYVWRVGGNNPSPLSIGK